MAALRVLLRKQSPWNAYAARTAVAAKCHIHGQQQGYFSSMPAASHAPSSSFDYIPGRATADGTKHFAERFNGIAAPGHFRTLRGTPQTGDLVVSSLGHGTYLGGDNDSEDREYMEALTRGFTLGYNMIDCASNFRTMRSEVTVGECLRRAIKQKLIDRSEIIVCSKAGFLSFDYREDIEPRTYIKEKYVDTGLFQLNEFVGGVHCLSGPFLKNQVEITRRNMNLETIDIYFVHNPEIQLNVVQRSTVLSRVKSAFEAMEQCVADGKISMYGVSSWNAFRQPSTHKLSMSLEELVYFAKEVGGENHHFKVIQLPYSLRHKEAATAPVQAVRGKRMPAIHAAHQLGIQVVGHSSINQANFSNCMPPDVRQKLQKEIGEGKSDAQCALHFVRTTPGLTSGVVGMRNIMHVEENAQLFKIPVTPRTEPL